MISTDDSTQRDVSPRDVSRQRDGSVSKPYLSFLALTAGIVVALVAVGQFPTRQLAGDGAVLAMVVGCSISFVAALLGTVPVVLARGLAAPSTVPAVMLSIAMRLGVVILLAISAMWSGWFENGPLLVWLVVSHALLQVADIRLTQQILYQN